MAVAATMWIERICKNCGKEFKITEGFYKSQTKIYGEAACTFCSRLCVVEWMKKRYDEAYEIKICKNCGKEFRILKSLTNNEKRKGRGKYCSLECFHKHGRSEIVCQKCGKVFSVLKCMDNRKYCSQKCAGVSRNRISKNCVVCGRDYEIISSDKDISKCCSFDCLIKYVAKLNTIHSLDARSRCGRKKWRQKRLQVLERDKYICQTCGAPHDLIVHHVINWRIVKNDNIDNLITLCRSCHWEAHGKKVKRQILNYV